MLRFEASEISIECHRGCETTLKEAALTPPRLPTCHLKRHQTRCDKLTWEASGSCLLARQPCHLIPLWHGVQETGGLSPALTSQARERSKHYFAWWDNLVTTRVCLCGSGACSIGRWCRIKNITSVMTPAHEPPRNQWALSSRLQQPQGQTTKTSLQVHTITSYWSFKGPDDDLTLNVTKLNVAWSVMWFERFLSFLSFPLWGFGIM